LAAICAGGAVTGAASGEARLPFHGTIHDHAATKRIPPVARRGCNPVGEELVPKVTPVAGSIAPASAG
jgi:hypothetical protein